MSFNEDRSANVSGEKEYNESFQDVYFLSSNLKFSIISNRAPLVSFLYSFGSTHLPLTAEG